jgi:hypothetical protein
MRSWKHFFLNQRSKLSLPSRQDFSETRENTRNSYILTILTRTLESGLVNIREIWLFSVAADKIVLLNIFMLENVRKVTCVGMFTLTCYYTRIHRPRVYVPRVFRDYCHCLDWVEKSCPCYGTQSTIFLSFSRASIYNLIHLRQLDGLFYRKQRSMITLRSQTCSNYFVYILCMFEWLILSHNQRNSGAIFHSYAAYHPKQWDDQKRIITSVEGKKSDQVSKLLPRDRLGLASSFRFANPGTKMLIRLWLRREGAVIFHPYPQDVHFALK